MVDIVKAETAFHTETTFVRRAIDALNIFHLTVFDLQVHKTANTTERANAFGLRIIILAVANLVFIHDRGRHQRPGRAGLYTFTASHTGRGTHVIRHVKHRIRIVTTASHADHVIHLNFTTGPHTERTGNTGVEVHFHRNVAVIEQRNAAFFQLGEAAFRYFVQIRHIPEMAGFVAGFFALRLIRNQHFQNHFARSCGAGVVRSDNHAFRGFADTGGRQRAFAFNVHHTGTTVAVRAIAGGRFVAQMRDHKTAAIGHFPDGFAGVRFDLLAVQGKFDLIGHAGSLSCSSRDFIRKTAITQTPIAPLISTNASATVSRATEGPLRTIGKAGILH